MATFLTLLMTSFSLVFAQEPVFETTITTAPLNSSYRKVITQDEIKKSSAKNMVQLLVEEAGITMTNSAFAPSSIYMRGGDAGHILFLIDGFAIYDAISDKRTFNLNSVNLASVKKIEVIKGSQAALYGGQALSGVIKIETINFDHTDNKLKARFDGGNKKTENVFLNWLDTSNSESIPQLSAYYQSRENDSPIKYSNYTYPEQQIAGDAAWLKKTEDSGTILLRARIFDEERDILGRDFTNHVSDAENFIADSQHNLIGISWIGRENKHQPKVSLSYVDSVRSYYVQAGGINPFDFDQKFEGNLVNVRVEQPLISEDAMKSDIGVSWAQENGKITNIHGQNPANDGRVDRFQQNLYSAFWRGLLNIDNKWSFEGGIRWEKIPDSDFVSFQLGSTYETWRFEFAQGVKTPTLFNYYDFQYGNPDLKTEVADTVTLEKSIVIDNETNLSLAGFYSRHKNLIDSATTPGGIKFVNFDAEISGVEVRAHKKFADVNNFDINATYQNPRDLEHDRRLIRRPYFTYSATLGRQWSDRLQTSLRYYYNGNRFDYGTSGTTFSDLKPYELVSLAASYNQSDNLNWYLKIQNIFDKRYAESFEFYSEGINGTIGLEYQN